MIIPVFLISVCLFLIYPGSVYKMAGVMSDNCGGCERVVTGRNKNAVECAKCGVWTHSDCAGVPVTTQNKPLLKHENLVYLCDGCLDATRSWWSCSKVSVGVQASQGTECKEVEAQTEEVMAQTEVKVQTEEVEAQTEEVKACECKEVKGTKGLQVRKVVRRRPPVRIVGDSMVKHARQQVRGNAEVTSMRGAKVEQVRMKVEEIAGEVENGLLIIQGGGNDLENVGEEETVKELVQAVKAVESKRMSVAVVGVLRRPSEGARYERLRRSTNARLQQEVLKLKVEWLKGRKGNVSFLDLDSVLREGMDYCRDGVHLNESGYDRMGKRLREWEYARSVECVSA